MQISVLLLFAYKYVCGRTRRELCYYRELWGAFVLFNAQFFSSGYLMLPLARECEA